MSLPSYFPRTSGSSWRRRSGLFSSCSTLRVSDFYSQFLWPLKSLIEKKRKEEKEPRLLKCIVGNIHPNQCCNSFKHFISAVKKIRILKDFVCIILPQTKTHKPFITDFCPDHFLKALVWSLKSQNAAQMVTFSDCLFGAVEHLKIQFAVIMEKKNAANPQQSEIEHTVIFWCFPHN